MLRHQNTIQINATTTGFASPAETYVDKRLDINDLIVKDHYTTFYFRYSGPTVFGVNQGDTIVIDRGEEPKGGDFYLSKLKQKNSISTKLLGINTNPTKNTFQIKINCLSLYKKLNNKNMKNIHVIPTDKASRLMIDTIENKLYFQPILHEKTANVLTQHIYITSDEEIKDVRPHKGKWQLEKGQILNKFPDYLTDLSECKLVILTTDPELIADGVQAIDDEFLEWFVKNPSCEEVVVEHFGTCCGNQSITQCINCKKYNPVYKIIIPQKEPKQETLNKINNMNEEIKKQINLLEEEQTRVKQFINENNFNCTTAPYVIAKQYRDEIKKHIGILKMNLEN